MPFLRRNSATAAAYSFSDTGGLPHWMSDGFFIGFRVVSPVKAPGDVEMQKWWTFDDKVTQKTTDRDRERRDVPKQGPVEK